MDGSSSLILTRHTHEKRFYFFGGLECVGHSLAYVALFVFLRDFWIRTQRAAVASRRATNLATHERSLKQLYLEALGL